MASTPGISRTDHVARYWATVRHLGYEQVLSRLRLRAAAKARALFPDATARVYAVRRRQTDLRWGDRLLGLQTAAAALSKVYPPAPAPEHPLRTSALLQGRFTFLNAAADLGWPPDWSAVTQPRLWRYHLHYFDDLLDIVLEHSSAHALQLVEHWIERNPVHGRGATPDAWHPYVVSIRMVNWMIGLSSVCTAEMLPVNVRNSLVEHALFLERNLETDVRGNHLLKNLKAMVFAGSFWEGATARTWRHTYGDAFTSELEAQLLSDGCHYERSPMYHSQVMTDGIEVAALWKSRNETDANLMNQLRRMDRFLPVVTHPDGDVALFNDSALGMTLPPSVLHDAMDRLRGGCVGPTSRRLDVLLGASPSLQMDSVGSASSPVRTAVPDSACHAHASGYVPVPPSDQARYLLADVGAVCPDELPAHAHADLLSFELSLDGHRLVVDSGVGEYASGQWREYYRSTRAHNTVMVDGVEQSDCWASFRVGRRATPANVRFANTDDGCVLEAEHTGYEHLSGRVRHRRRFLWKHHGFWVIGDAILGTGRHTWSSFCHLHPEAIILRQEPGWIRVARETSVLDLCWYGCDSASCVSGQTDDLQGWYADRFGSPRPSTVLVLAGSGELPVEFGYALIPQASRDAPAPAVAVVSQGVIQVRVGDSHYRIENPAAGTSA